ncbi:hypothetical protein IW140_000491 [Coemansia sp. RSA 1813]|nr:hypothetical protein EV178_000550 [Coemansia sp. RSA 1646]KAJ1771261.1 hypothetical protein LPJ74_002529 [Coemansia sp. RSA 1843]KAJ2217670.1 hypothetical protein EV179_000155 [Coemansia sp. RSA 487]KAJ2573092.1 hypothetical protein IW140_000491 [Coemansia sp. RSA 1813]
MAARGTRPPRSNNPRTRSQATSTRGRRGAQGASGLNRRGRISRSSLSPTTRGRGAAQQQRKSAPLHKPSDTHQKEPDEHVNLTTVSLGEKENNPGPAASAAESSSGSDEESSDDQTESSAVVSEKESRNSSNYNDSDSDSKSDSGDSEDSSTGDGESAEPVQKNSDNQNSNTEQHQLTAATTDQTPTDTNGSTISIIARLNASEPLLDHGLAVQVDSYDQNLNEDDERETDQPFGSRGTAADLAVLDYMSDCILDEVSSAELLTKSSSAMNLTGTGHLDAESVDGANVAMRRLDCLAREQALFRRNHFTRGLFLDNKHRPSDELSLERWFMSLGRINVATFALLIFRPQAVVAETVAKSMPNHERIIASLGLRAAAQAFFEHIVPLNKRNADTLSLLVDIQTQMWLLAANDEASLQEIIAGERSTSDDSIKKLLSIYPHTDYDDDCLQLFDTLGVSMYRSEVNRRLNRISGGKLNITRSQFPINDLWISLSEYCIAKVAGESPCVIRHTLSDKGPEGSDFELAADDEDISDSLRIDEPVDESFEITIFKEPESKDSAVPTTTVTDIIDSNGSSAKARNGDTSIDPSFLEERRVAVLLRDALSDNYLDDLMAKLDAEPIDVSQPRMRTRMSERTQPVQPARTGLAPDAADDGRFRLQIGESDDGWDVGSNNNDKRAEEQTTNTPSPMRTRSHGKRQRIYLGNEDHYLESSDDEHTNSKVPRMKSERGKQYRDLSDPEEAESMQQILSVIKGTPQPKGVRYSPLKLGSSTDDGFQGRRGIAAEDISELVRSHSPVRFTQSFDGFSEPDDDGANSEASEAAGTRRLVPTASAGEEDAAERLGQYQPVQRAQKEPDETDDEYDGDGKPRLRARRLSRKTKQQTQHRTRWTQEEEECFVRAMYEHGNGWTAILGEHGVNGTVDHILAKRNRENLKDKARNIKIRLMREGKPLGPFSNACGRL